jgi:hypothetical protein
MMELPINYNETHYTERRIVREEYVRQQEGLCYYCKGLLNEKPPSHIMKMKVTKSLFPKSFFKWPVHLHHDHGTGMTIGAVHCYCNAVLWEHEGE